MEKSVKKCPPYHLISSAVDGNDKSVDKVLTFYDAYISKASLRPLYDEYGNVYIAVDMELKGRIREAIMKMIPNFEVKIK
ncbi:helix-turn-helix domain-containing protein [Enterococcus faecalis]|uniref:Helix-turn-helix domain-containing protein n=1 Tax=Enterococcus cecorum TaxID=44008 RepID=A0A7X9NPJ2_9ENTE|nr:MULTISPECIES: helix-turn-helix domain-containing protein [Lactobacillales]EGO6638215.1 helix-turn-helix domain-containing protein [Enterococcus faecalis]NME50606.1 helix-turn-helix domain-containing protein [Enterococcus cecorum]HEL1135466.1 helix-turn-helix domain-containing protein [Streptococcus equi subsp. zooepidemicus]EHQ8823917.1 helix-turn-helix domain-containing protein [Enterococcus faecalis]EHR4133121.1 helix-turn-helix domain-containing protein [Enterococcus faecalis]